MTNYLEITPYRVVRWIWSPPPSEPNRSKPIRSDPNRTAPKGLQVRLIRHRNKTRAYHNIDSNVHIVHSTCSQHHQSHRTPVSSVQVNCEGTKIGIYIYFLISWDKLEIRTNVSLFYQQENSFEGLYSILYRIKNKILYSPLEEFSAQKTGSCSSSHF